MAFTRFHDDPCRIMKQLQQSTDPCLYYLNQPGNGSSPPFMGDPQILLQKWGANLRTNTINLESSLIGMDRRLGRDCLGAAYPNTTPASRQINYPVYQKEITEQPRTTNPAWNARDLEQTSWWILPLDPQENVCLPFQNNLDTRKLEKDNYMPCGYTQTSPPVKKRD